MQRVCIVKSASTDCYCCSLYWYHTTLQQQHLPTHNKQYDLTKGSTQWEVLISEPLRIVRAFDHTNSSWPVDRKWVVSGRAASGPLQIQFSVLSLAEGELVSKKITYSSIIMLLRLVVLVLVVLVACMLVRVL
jgi:hypothetical protein